MTGRNKLTDRLRTARVHLDKHLDTGQRRPAGAAPAHGRSALQRAVDMLRNTLRR
ncbi:hypothetical protein [Nocardia altamirensis]|uniref:hypothetical protein n=1 Tax=Nocardia altamirensis TaxID=472158 RepID=UPI00143553BD|nr:hypothetical protein [Nocardia altamirensis]